MIVYRKRAIEARYRTAWGQLRGPVPIHWWQVGLVCLAAAAAIAWALGRNSAVFWGGLS